MQSKYNEFCKYLKGQMLNLRIKKKIKQMRKKEKKQFSPNQMLVS